MMSQFTALTMSPALFQLSFTSHLHHQNISLSSIHTAKPNQKSSNITRRTKTLILTIPLLSVLVQPHSAMSLDLRLTVPDQTLEEAESVVKSHAQSLLDVKDLLNNAESSYRKEAQKQLRKSSGLLRQDLYTIIQGKSPELRPKLRKLYADLFNGVVKLDYALRDKDREDEVWELYDTVVMVLNQILSRV